MDITSVIRQGRATIPTTIVLLLVVAIAAACGGGATATGPADRDEPSTTAPAPEPPPAPRPTGTIDGLVAVDGGRLHVRCRGAGDSTVLLLSGFAGTADAWSAVEPEVARHARVCAYDRFGTGTSDAPPTPQTFATQARDLRALLSTVGEPGPYVLVGHSFGGAEAVMFADEFRSEVRGLVLVEASPIGWDQVICAIGDDPSEAAAGFRQACEMQASPAGNPERLDGPAAFAELASVRSLDDLPLLVATAPERRSGTAGLPIEAVRRVNDAWDRGQERWASLSSDSRLLVVPGTGHDIHQERPDVVVGLIDELTDGPPTGGVREG